MKRPHLLDLFCCAGWHGPFATEASMSDLNHWLTYGRYLPQKELFKALQEVVERRNAKYGFGSYTAGLSWITARIYVIDVFLLVMAKHGYTLQRTRAQGPFEDLSSFVSGANERERQASAVAICTALKAEGRDDG